VGFFVFLLRDSLRAGPNGVPWIALGNQVALIERIKEKFMLGTFGNNHSIVQH
jgi:hypothetical protein